VKMSIKVSLCMLALLICAVVASAANMNGPVTIRVSSLDNSAVWQQTYNPVQSGNTWSYQLDQPVDLVYSGNQLGRLTSLAFGVQGDPAISLDFAIHAFVPVNVFIDSGTLTFAPINNPTAFATGGLTLTADNNGATLDGNFSGGKAYEATYNGGTVFADLLPSFSAQPTTTNTENDRFPPTGLATVGTSVSSMRSQYSFSLSGGDDASGTSRFSMEPVPDASTLALAFAGCAPLLGGLALRRRRA